MGFFQIIAVMLFVEDLVVWVVGGRSLNKNRAPKGMHLTFHGFLAFQIVLLTVVAVGRLRHLDLERAVPTPLFVVMVIWHLLVAPMAMVACLLGVFGEATGVVVRRLASWRAGRLPAAEPAPEGLTRREFLGNAMAMTPPMLTFALSTIAAGQLAEFRTRRISLSIRDLPPALDGVTIAHVSDLHLGRFTHGPVARQVMEAVNALKCDLVLFTGDLINDSLAWLPEGIALLKTLNGPLFLCEGNHDLFDDPEQFEARVKASGLTLLINETATLPVRGIPVQILGLRWGGPPNYGMHRHDEQRLAASMEQLLLLRDRDAFPILMAHHPHAWDYATDLPLTLSGHTHGGQLMLNERLGFGPVMFRYWSGLYTRQTKQALVVSNGVGNWFPLRTAAPAELVHLTLRRA